MATDERDDIWYACGYTSPPQQRPDFGSWLSLCPCAWHIVDT